MQKDTNHEQSISKTNAILEPERRGSKTKQSRLENLLPPPLHLLMWQRIPKKRQLLRIQQ
jgi:hypothetical protein